MLSCLRGSVVPGGSFGDWPGIGFGLKIERELVDAYVV